VGELTRLRGQVLYLQMELADAKRQAQAASAIVGATTSMSSSFVGAPHLRHSTASSCGGTYLAATAVSTSSPEHCYPDSWGWQSQDSLTQGQGSVRTPGGPAGGRKAGAQGLTAAAAGCSPGVGGVRSPQQQHPGTPGSQLLLLSGRNKELQALCRQREAQVWSLENDLQRLTLELKQQAAAAAAAAAAGVGGIPGGFATPRGGLAPLVLGSSLGSSTPRHHGHGLQAVGGIGGLVGPGPSLFSPQRRAASSPGSAVVPAMRPYASSLTGGIAAAARGSSPSGGSVVGGCGPQQVTNVNAPHHLPPTRFALSSCGALAHSGLSSSATDPQQQHWQTHHQQQQQQQYSLDSKASKDPHRELLSAAAVRASLDEVSVASSSSSRSKGRGLRVGAGRPPLHVPALKRTR
jgi:hypothetical protein